MRLHANAKLSVKGRELLIDRVEVAGWSLTQAAEAARIVSEWLADMSTIAGRSARADKRRARSSCSS